MIKRDITETIYEYDNEGKLVKKTVIETHEEEEEKTTISTYEIRPTLTNPCKPTHYYNNDSVTATDHTITVNSASVK